MKIKKRDKKQIINKYKRKIARETIIVEVLGGVAYCDDPRVEIYDHDSIIEKY